MTRRNLGIGALALALMLGCALAARTQPSPGQRQVRGQGRGQARILALRIPAAELASALKLSGDQAARIKAVQDKYRTDSQGLRPQPGAQPDPTSTKKRRDLAQAANAEIQSILSADQRTRLQEVVREWGTLQQAGIPAGVVSELNLTADQKTKIAGIGREATEKTRGLSPEDRRARGREIRQEAAARVQAVLTDAQKAAIEKWRKEHPRQGRQRQRA